LSARRLIRVALQYSELPVMRPWQESPRCSQARAETGIEQPVDNCQG